MAVFGSQTAEAVAAIRKEIEAFLGRKRGPRDLLVDITSSEVPSEEAFRVSLTAVQEVPFRRLAVFGGKPAVLLNTHQMMEEGGSNDRLKVFRSEALARQWLRQAGHPVRAKLKQQTERLLPGKE